MSARKQRVNNASNIGRQVVAYFFVFLAPYIRDIFRPVWIDRGGKHCVTFTLRSTVVLYTRSEQQNVPVPSFLLRNLSSAYLQS